MKIDKNTQYNVWATALKTDKFVSANVVLINLFYLLFYFFLANKSIKRICTFGWFVRTENNNCKPNTNNFV